MEFDLGEALRARQALRDALGLGPESFPMPAFIGMVSDEIEEMRTRGRTDEEIAALLSSTTGKTVSVQDIGTFYATPDERHQGKRA